MKIKWTRAGTAPAAGLAHRKCPINSVHSCYLPRLSSHAVGSFPLWAGLGPLVPPTAWGSWRDEGADAGVGNNGCGAGKSFPEAAAVAAGNEKGENPPPPTPAPAHSLTLEIIT